MKGMNVLDEMLTLTSRINQDKLQDMDALISGILKSMK